MTAHPISIADARPLTDFKLFDIKVTDPERWAEIQEQLKKFHDLSSATPEEQAQKHAAQIAKQNAVEVHSIYRANGRVIAVLGRTGGTTTASNADGGVVIEAMKEAEARGLTGEALNDYIADRLTEALKAKYGASLRIEQFEPGTGPNMGQAHVEMFNVTGTGRKLYSTDMLRVFTRLMEQVA